MARNLVVCLDGTGNEIGSNLSNVLKLYRMVERDDDQLVYYDPGVGTIGQPGWWSELKQQVRSVLGLALGLGLDENVLDAYSWLCRNWRDGDEIFLFGFSRGAYTARVLAGFIHLVGLLRPDQLNLCGYALVAYKKAADLDNLKIGSTFGRVSLSRRTPIRFVGCWDTVASVITPRPDRLYLPSLQTLPFTRKNPSVRTFRQAIAIDERRRMFRLNHWRDPQPYNLTPFERERDVPQDIRQVWFAGVHADIGGGYPEGESQLSKYPLLWMIGEAEGAGLRFQKRLVDYLGRGISQPDTDSRYDYVAPDYRADIHRSLSAVWWPLEILPKYYKYLEWAKRWPLFDFYLPAAEPRPIPNRPDPDGDPPEPFLVHSSAVARIDARRDYRPVNLPATFQIETAKGPPPPPIPAPPYRRPPLSSWLGGLVTTLAPLRTWGLLLASLSALVLALLVLDRLEILLWHRNFGILLSWAALVALGTALVEEIFFRGVLLRPPPDGATGFGPAVLSALLFALWHPLQAVLYDPPWEARAWDGGFLAACALLGFACARLVLATRSIWPAVALHWLAALGWAALYGGPVGQAWSAP